MTESERRSASEKYYQELREKLDEHIRKDSRLNALSRKIAENAADFNDTAQYSELVSNHIGAVLQENIGEISSPLAKEFVCTELLKDQHSAINETLGRVQVSIDEKNGIHLNPQKAPFPFERVRQVTHALEDPTVKPETIRRRANAPVANVAKSFHDDYIRTNAKLRNDLGLKPVIQRYGANCCAWCSAVAGKYRFGEQPEDIFRRHDNCDCVIIYDTQVLRGKQTADGGRSKTWEEVDPSDFVQDQPTVFTQEQAKAIEQQNLQYIGLTNDLGSGIMEEGKNYGKYRGQLDVPYEGMISTKDLDEFNKNALNSIMEETGFSEKEAREAHSAIVEWCGDDYKSFTNGQQKDKEKIINNCLSRMGAYDGEIQRGLSFTNAADGAEFKNAEVGKTVSMKSVSAWSNDSGVAARYSKKSSSDCDSVVLVCDSNKSAVGVQHISKWGTMEAEVLSPSTAKWEVTKKTVISKYDYLKNEVLPKTKIPPKKKMLENRLKNEEDILKTRTITILQVKEV